MTTKISLNSQNVFNFFLQKENLAFVVANFEKRVYNKL